MVSSVSTRGISSQKPTFIFSRKHYPPRSFQPWPSPPSNTTVTATLPDANTESSPLETSMIIHGPSLTASRLCYRNWNVDSSLHSRPGSIVSQKAEMSPKPSAKLSSQTTKFTSVNLQQAVPLLQKTRTGDYAKHFMVSKEAQGTGTIHATRFF